MPSDEEKEASGRENAENEAAEREPADQFADGQAPAEGESPAQESEEQPEAEETPEEKKKSKEKKFWLLSLGLVLLLLGGGGFYAVTGMRQAAHKLGGGTDYDQLSANSSVYDGKAGAARNANYFPLDEDAARAGQAAQAAAGPEGDRVNPSLARTSRELAADAAGRRASQGAAGGNNAEEEAASAQPSGAAPGQAAMAEKLQARAFRSGGGIGSTSSKNSPAAAGAAAFRGNGPVVGRASEQRETRPGGAPKKAGRGSVMEAMKGAFKATFYGARLSSKDAARGWTARAFDGSAEATTAIQYDEELRKLDKVNPDAIPGFLRDQDLSADGAKSLTVSNVAKPKIDKDGTKEALAEDKDYQAKKNELSGSMINNLFKGLPGTEPPVNDDRGGPAGPNSRGNFADPEDEQDITAAGLTDFVETEGFGGECGCTAEAPCCCLPQNSVTEQNCPLYGPFQENDPCGDAMYGGGAAGTSGAIMAGE